jgi:hypothetical protein
MRLFWRVTAIYISCILMPAITGLSASDQTYRDMVDPVFGLKFDPKQVHFDVVPKKLFDRCKELHSGPLWVFAHAVIGGEEYFIVSGYSEYHPDALPPNSGEYEPDFGSTVILTTRDCVVEPADAFVIAAANDPDPPDAQARALATDAMSRMIASLGKEKFCQGAKDALAKHEVAQMKLPVTLRTRVAQSWREALNNACATSDHE